MLTVQVEFRVKTNEINNFTDITRYNVENSRKEKGVERFDFYKISGTENTFILFEAYTSEDDQKLHRETEHFIKWKQRVAELIEEPYKITVLEEV